MEKVKLIQSYDDGTTKSKKCPIFSGTEGIEGIRPRKNGRTWPFNWLIQIEMSLALMQRLRSSICLIARMRQKIL
eukprot:7787635-Ditylum_brightwellii.AAC.2